MNTEELQKILELHRKWLDGEEEGLRANLIGADLIGADLSGASLSRACLIGANISDADLSSIKQDYLSILASAKHEVVDLYKSLLEGKIDGSTYAGECACLVGTIANIRGVDHIDMDDIRPDHERPAEKWFLAIRKGDTPDNNPVAEIVKEWTEEFMNDNGITIPKRVVSWE